MMASIFFIRLPVWSGLRPPPRRCQQNWPSARARAVTVLAAASRRNGSPSEDAGGDADVEVGLHGDLMLLRRSGHRRGNAEAVGLEVGRKLHVVELEIGARRGRKRREMGDLHRRGAAPPKGGREAAQEREGLTCGSK